MECKAFNDFHDLSRGWMAGQGNRSRRAGGEQRPHFARRTHALGDEGGIVHLDQLDGYRIEYGLNTSHITQFSCPDQRDKGAT
jgi:hypothetical protein